MKARFGAMLSDGLNGVIHATSDGNWSYIRENFTLCGRKARGVRHNMNSDVEITCKTCIKVGSND